MLSAWNPKCSSMTSNIYDKYLQSAASEQPEGNWSLYEVEKIRAYSGKDQLRTHLLHILSDFYVFNLCLMHIFFYFKMTLVS